MFGERQLRLKLEATETKLEHLREAFTTVKLQLAEREGDLRVAEERLRNALQEVDRLMAILTGPQSEQPADIASATAAPTAAPQPIRMLSGLEVVQRATVHRNTHNKAMQGR